jgi:hypothetical protein
LNPEYARLAEKRINSEAPMFNEVEVNCPAAQALRSPLQTSLPDSPEPAS